MASAEPDRSLQAPTGPTTPLLDAAAREVDQESTRGEQVAARLAGPQVDAMALQADSGLQTEGVQDARESDGRLGSRGFDGVGERTRDPFTWAATIDGSLRGADSHLGGKAGGGLPTPGSRGGSAPGRMGRGGLASQAGTLGDSRVSGGVYKEVGSLLMELAEFNQKLGLDDGNQETVQDAGLMLMKGVDEGSESDQALERAEIANLTNNELSPEDQEIIQNGADEQAKKYDQEQAESEEAEGSSDSGSSDAGEDADKGGSDADQGSGEDGPGTQRAAPASNITPHPEDGGGLRPEMTAAFEQATAGLLSRNKPIRRPLGESSVMQTERAPREAAGAIQAVQNLGPLILTDDAGESDIVLPAGNEKPEKDLPGSLVNPGSEPDGPGADEPS